MERRVVAQLLSRIEGGDEIPDRETCAQILKIICKNFKLEQTKNYERLAK